MIPVRNAVDTQERDFMTNDDLLLPIPDHLWPVWLYHFFAHYLINGTIFGGKTAIEHKTCDFSLYLLPLERDIIHVQ